MPTIQILHVPGCHSLALARSRVRAAIDRADGEVDVSERVINREELAIEAGMAGSPTILVDGRDMVGPGERAMSLACRLYRTPSGLDGAPTVEAIVAALDGR